MHIPCVTTQIMYASVSPLERARQSVSKAVTPPGETATRRYAARRTWPRAKQWVTGSRSFCAGVRSQPCSACWEQVAVRAKETGRRRQDGGNAQIGTDRCAANTALTYADDEERIAKPFAVHASRGPGDRQAPSTSPNQQRMLPVSGSRFRQPVRLPRSFSRPVRRPSSPLSTAGVIT